MSPEEADYHELCYYTLAHGHPSFIHQHVVDAFGAQSWHEQDKPIKLTFSLVGLFLHVEKGYSGSQVQRAHMALARRKQIWPTFAIPLDRGSITSSDVLAAEAGTERDKMIHEWCACVWEAFRENRAVVAGLVDPLLGET